MIWLVVIDDVVVNRIVWSGDTADWQPPAQAEMIAGEDAPGVDIGWQRVAGDWLPPDSAAG